MPDMRPFLCKTPIPRGGLTALPPAGVHSTRKFELNPMRKSSLTGGAAWLNYAILAQEHRCGELVEVAPADIKAYRATVRTTKKGMRL